MTFIIDFLSKNWLGILQTAGIASSLFFAGVNYRREIRSRRVTNFIELTKLHRDLWKLPSDNTDLLRLFDLDPSRMAEKFTEEDRRFLTMMLVHMQCYFEMSRTHQVVFLSGVEADYKEIFSAPMVRRYWEEHKRYYPDRFVKFVDGTAGPPTLAFRERSLRHDTAQPDGT